jgi:hypothetical protein
MGARLTEKAHSIRVGDHVRHKRLDGWLVVMEITPDGVAWCTVQDGGWMACGTLGAGSREDRSSALRRQLDPQSASLGESRARGRKPAIVAVCEARQPISKLEGPGPGALVHPDSGSRLLSSATNLRELPGDHAEDGRADSVDSDLPRPAAATLDKDHKSKQRQDNA